MADRRVFVNYLAPYTTEDTLCRIFCMYGHIEDLYMAKDPKSGLSRGIATLTFASGDQAQVAVQHMNAQTVDGYKIRVYVASSWAYSHDDDRCPEDEYGDYQRLSLPAASAAAVVSPYKWETELRNKHVFEAQRPIQTAQ
ncbi:hypothetical protein BGZ70_001047 [Mortierella alpina]|uniref:RRM domain-containing protein n=1 Tax=Mortierella alpina TaxID=64518 RepID=A0A9P6LYH1_MORAP|nr:hypothetical protein BGZ70_001047 [Mortierella alpina]